MIKQASAYGRQPEHLGTVGAGPVAAKQARREAIEAKRGKKTQGSCSGHESCNKGGCKHAK